MEFERALVTGGCGFIGTNLVSQLKLKDDCHVLNLDKLTYASNELHTKNAENYEFRRVDIIDRQAVTSAINEFRPDIIFHLAAESHVDNSIKDATPFLHTNVIGTYTLLEAANEFYNCQSTELQDRFRFIHVSTDEVFGALSNADRGFSEDSNILPNSPYAASKASSDLLVRAWRETYSFPAIITNCSNNYGAWQNVEKLIPKTIFSLINNIPIPIYGNGQQIRDWLHVEDHTDALLLIANNGVVGSRYNIGGNNEIKNLDLVHKICRIFDEEVGNTIATSERLIKFVDDRLGHDYRYSINASKLRHELGWKPTRIFEIEIRNIIKRLLDRKVEVFSFL